MDQLIAILRTLMKHWAKLVAVPALTMGLIYYFTADVPQKYKTEARLYLNLQETKGISLSDEDLKQYQIHTYFQNIVELLKSARTIEKVRMAAIEGALSGDNFWSAGNEKLIENKESVERRLSDLRQTNAVLLPHAYPDSIMISYLNFHQLSTERLKGMMLSFRVMDSNFMKFELTESLPLKTQLLASMFIQALIEENRELSKNKIKGHKDLIDELVRQAKTELDAKVKMLERFKVENSIINLGEHTKAIVTYLVQLEGTRANLLGKISASTKGKSQVMSTVNDGNEIMFDLTSHSEIVGLKETLRKLNKDALTASLANNSGNLEAVQTNIDNTKAAIDAKLIELTRKTPYDPSRLQLELASKYINYDLDAETSIDMVTIVDTEIQRVTSYSKKFAPFESTVVALEQEISTAQNAYLTLLNKLNMTQTIESGSGENMIEVIDPPYYPAQPEPSKRLILVASGGIAVFVLMAAVFIIVQLLDASITSVDKFERSSRLPVISALPNLEPKEKDEKLAQSLQLIHHQQVLQLSQIILSKCLQEEGILMITSSQQGEGKHYLALQIQQALNESGRKIAFVDADWLNDVAYESFISIKDLVANHGLIKNQSIIAQKIDDLKKENDLVVIITSPINISAEAGYWMGFAKHVLYTFGANRILTKVDARVEAMLLESRLQFLGTVLNRVDVENMEDYLGEIPKKRSFMRRVAKKLITRDF